MPKISEDDLFDWAERLALQAVEDPTKVGDYERAMLAITKIEGGWKVKTRQSQNDKVLKHLKSGKTLSPLEALGIYGIYRLAARIFELREAGHEITADIKDDGQGRTYAEYSLA